MLKQFSNYTNALNTQTLNTNVQHNCCLNLNKKEEEHLLGTQPFKP